MHKEKRNSYGNMIYSLTNNLVKFAIIPSQTKLEKGHNVNIFNILLELPTANFQAINLIILPKSLDVTTFNAALCKHYRHSSEKQLLNSPVLIELKKA